MRPKRICGDRLLILPLPNDSTSGGGIIIPETAKGKPTRGEVLMIGDDPKIREKSGDFITFPDQAGTDFSMDGKDVKLIRWQDVQMELDRDKPSFKELLSKIQGKKVPLEIVGIQNEGLSTECLRLRLHGDEAIDFDLYGNLLTHLADET